MPKKMKNKQQLPSYAPIAVVMIAAAIAGVAIVSQPGMPENTAVIPTQTPSGIVTVAYAQGGFSNTASVAQSVGIGSSMVVSWNSADFPSATVNVTIIRKVSEDPARYQPLRTLANVPNTGSTLWTPGAGEVGENIFVEVGCTATSESCQARISPVSYTVTQ